MHQFSQDGQYFGLAGTNPAVSVGDAVNVTSFLTNAVPEPNTLLLAAVGILGITVAIRRRRTVTSQ
jgi:hypothetical protein